MATLIKYIVIIILFIGSVGCQNEKSKVTSLNNNLNDVWGLSSYFDSITKNKKVAKYRIQAPSWFGILLEIKNDSIYSYGSIVDSSMKYSKKSDTLTTFNSIGGKWYLIKHNNEELHLKQSPNNTTIDSTTYIYRRRPNLSYLTKNPRKVHKISNNITYYFNDKIMSGEYQNEESGDTIVFKPDGSISGLNDFNNFKVRNYFGTLHPHKNLDVLTLTNTDKKSYKEFNWVFKDEKLILTEFKEDRVGNKFFSDDYILGEQIIKLKKLN